MDNLDSGLLIALVYGSVVLAAFWLAGHTAICALALVTALPAFW